VVSFIERKVEKILEKQSTIESADVRIKRVLGNDKNANMRRSD